MNDFGTNDPDSVNPWDLAFGLLYCLLMLGTLLCAARLFLWCLDASSPI
jgi:hypothetical protein